MSELVERLRGPMGCSIAAIERQCREAADRISALTASRARLRRALASIANNTCCDGCQEAALVALAALSEDARAALKEDSHE